MKCMLRSSPRSENVLIKKFASTDGLWFLSASRDNTDMVLCFEVEGNNDFILITASIRHKYYRKYSIQILQQGFDTNITESIRYKYYSKYLTQININSSNP